MIEQRVARNKHFSKTAFGDMVSPFPFPSGCILMWSATDGGFHCPLLPSLPTPPDPGEARTKQFAKMACGDLVFLLGCICIWFPLGCIRIHSAIVEVPRRPLLPSYMQCHGQTLCQDGLRRPGQPPDLLTSKSSAVNGLVHTTSGDIARETNNGNTIGGGGGGGGSQPSALRASLPDSEREIGRWREGESEREREQRASRGPSTLPRRLPKRIP